MKKKMLASAATALVLPMAYAANLPDLKEGLWSVHTQTTDNPGNKKSEGNYTICRNHAFDQYSNGLGKNVKGCTLLSETFAGGKYSSAMHCVAGGTAIESKGTTTGLGGMATHTETHATYTPAMSGISETSTIMDQKYVGSCPAGTLPGDRTTADGRVTHTWKK